VFLAGLGREGASLLLSPQGADGTVMTSIWPGLLSSLSSTCSVDELKEEPSILLSLSLIAPAMKERPRCWSADFQVIPREGGRACVGPWANLLTSPLKNESNNTYFIQLW
jgi:hypothetical protein